MIRSCVALGACALLGAAGCSTIDGRTDGGDATLRPVEQRLPRNDYASRWSPDGQEILFTSRVEGVYWLHVLDLESGRVRRPVDAPPNQRGGAVSPDGSRIAFVARGPTDRPDDTELYVIDADGSGLRRLTENRDFDGEVPAWSPDGRRVVFWSERDGNRDIYSIEADGTGLRRLTRHPAQDRHPSYSPDSGRIVFWSSRDGDPEIYVMPAKGGEARQLTRNEVYDGGPGTLRTGPGSCSSRIGVGPGGSGP